jgi:hypothetical protein
LFGDEVYDGWRLELNCNVHRIQLKVSLVPLYKSLKKIVLVVTCAPSLEDCYIFEFATQHALVDFDRYHHEGDILVRKWYMKRWSEEPTQLADHIARRLYDVAEEVIEKSAARFGGER